MTVSARRALTVDDATGTDLYVKDADTVQAPASTLKIMTAYTVRQWIDDDALSDTVTVTGAYGGAFGIGLEVDDVVSYEDLLYGMMLASGNDCAAELAAAVGTLILAAEGGSGDAGARFLTEMQNVAINTFGWSGTVFADSYGSNNNSRLSARQLAELLLAVNDDATLTSIMGSLTHDVTVTGPNPRTIPVAHTIDPEGTVAFPEFVAGKTGSTSVAGGCLAMLWDHGGQRYASVVMGSLTNLRFADLRLTIDAVIASV